jgi:hypothetical protein
MSVFASKFDRKFVATAGPTITNCLVRIAGNKVFADPDIAEGLKCSVIESG